MNILEEFCKSTIDELALLNAPQWAEKWVDKRMELCRKFFKGKSTSTTHGTDIFQNIIDCLNGAKWKEEGDLGNNFREIIRLHKS